MTDTTAPAAAPTARLLFVDDEPSILNALKRMFRGRGYEIFIANSGKEGLALLEQQSIDLVMSDMRMPEMDGAQFLEQVFTRWPDVKRILLTGYSEVTATIAAINRGKIWCYVSKPWNDEELMVTVEQALAHSHLLHENARLTELTRQQNEELKVLNAGLEQKVAERTAELRKANADLHQSFLATVQMFSNLIELREGRLAGHSRRVADLARQVAERLGLDAEEQRNVLLAGLLHDIGKVGLPDKLIEHAVTALPPLDQKEVMGHAAKGQQLLMGVPQLTQAARIVRHHHECLDGSGYPDGIAGLMIPLGARILAVANDYDALQSGSLLLRQCSPKEAREFIIKQRGKRYDPTVVDAFMALVGESELKREVEIPVAPADLKTGMVLTRELLHPAGYPLLPKGRVVDAAVMAELMRLQESTATPITVYIRRSSGPAVLRDKADEPPPRLWKEVALPVGRLLEGMMLSRNLHHHDGYLLLARGNHLDAAIIRQLRDIETASKKPITVHIRVDDR
ncbi:MAG: response regulator [Rhodocyclales bacterium]|nr:response regulator [Rhodocyclales bacterium]